MMFPRLGFGHNNQKGFTLLELIIAIAIAGLITAGITVAIMQILTINTRASNHMVAVRQVQQAGKEVSKDTLQAQPTKIDDDPSEAFLVLNWTDSQGGNNTVVYRLEPMPSSPALSMLARNHTINGTAWATAPPVVAEYIDPDKTSCVWASGVLTFNVTATVGGESETRIYEIDPRPS
ncbi:prepilin-type N-terminal cleavage/methylation domain-containing protein [Chloroflexota bacterium]